jgi:hypothetical protein
MLIRPSTVHMNRTIKYLFIDGASFQKTCSDICMRLYGNTDLYDLIDFRNFLDPYDRSFYYDALPVKTDDITPEQYQKKLSAKEELFNRLNLVPNLRVHEGVTRARLARKIK